MSPHLPIILTPIQMVTSIIKMMLRFQQMRKSLRQVHSIRACTSTILMTMHSLRNDLLRWMMIWNLTTCQWKTMLADHCLFLLYRSHHM
jgi:hypothetical protein